MVVIRNRIADKLVTDGKRIPLNFDSMNKACLWLNRNGNPKHLIPVDIKYITNPEEKKQLLKINFQKKVV